MEFEGDTVNKYMFRICLGVMLMATNAAHAAPYGRYAVVLHFAQQQQQSNQTFPHKLSRFFQTQVGKQISAGFSLTALAGSLYWLWSGQNTQKPVVLNLPATPVNTDTPLSETQSDSEEKDFTQRLTEIYIQKADDALFYTPLGISTTIASSIVPVLIDPSSRAQQGTQNLRDVIPARAPAQHESKYLTLFARGKVLNAIAALTVGKAWKSQPQLARIDQLLLESHDLLYKLHSIPGKEAMKLADLLEETVIHVTSSVCR